jgi:hypothetical protein
VRLRRTRPAGVPYGDLAALMRAVRRTTVVRLVLGIALAALLLAAFVIALDEDVRAEAFLPPERSGIVVVDMSASVSPLTYRRIGRALRRIAAANEPVGVIVFSDAAYELFPPGTPGRELTPLVRYFTPLPGRRGSPFDADFPPNPWQANFSGGTRISEGLRVARAVLERDEIEQATVLLISDLEAPQSDRLRIVDAVTTLQNDGYGIRVVPLFPQPQNREFFAQLVGPDAIVAESSLAAPIEADELGLGGKTPWLFLTLAGALVALLAANERWCGRLVVPWRPAA